MDTTRVLSAHTRLEGFRLADGQAVSLALAYTRCGPRAAPAYLLLHGYAGSHFALAAHPGAADAGWASPWAGDDKALDTTQVQVVTVNLPGSSYGSRWHGAEHGHASVRGMAAAIAALLEQLGIGALAGAIGYSFGGYVALQLKADHPHRVKRVLGLCTAPRGRGSAGELPALRALVQPSQRAAFRLGVLERSGLKEWAQDQGAAARQAEYGRVQQWAREFSADSLWRLRAAAIGFDVGACPAGTTLLHASSDTLFPPQPHGKHMHVVHTPYGHQALLYQPGPWIAPIRSWLRQEPLPTSIC